MLSETETKAIILALASTRGEAGLTEDEAEVVVLSAADAKTVWTVWQMVIDGRLALDVRDGEPVVSVPTANAAA